jgi:hypothetical protein
MTAEDSAYVRDTIKRIKEVTTRSAYASLTFHVQLRSNQVKRMLVYWQKMGITTDLAQLERVDLFAFLIKDRMNDMGDCDFQCWLLADEIIAAIENLYYRTLAIDELLADLES